MEANLSSRFDELERRLADRDGTRDPVKDESLLNALLAATRTDDFRQMFDGLMSAYLPHDEWRSAIVATDVRDRIDSLLWRRDEGAYGEVAMPAFFGRERQLSDVDRLLEESDRGVVVICAASGAGKSAFMAKWSERRIAAGDAVIRHFVSIKFPTTTSPVSCLQHLLVQLRDFDREANSEREASIPDNEQDLMSSIYSRLRKDAPDGGQVIVLIDALDELDTPFLDTFVRSDLGRGNWVIISRRIDPESLVEAPGQWPPPVGRWPIDLRRWVTAKLPENGSPTTIALPPLSEGDVILWLEEFLGDVPASQLDAMAAKLRAVTDGLPLFLKYLIKDISDRKLSGEHLADFIERLDSPFAGFLRQVIYDEFDHIAGLRVHRPMSADERALVAILSQMKGEISASDLRRLCGHGQSPIAAISMETLDHRLRRWLSFRPGLGNASDTSERIIFDHPKLAVEFANALGESEVEKAIDRILDFVIEAWRPTRTRFGPHEHRGSIYALRHAIGHLLDLGEIDEAAALLMNEAFYGERFIAFPPFEAVDLMTNDWDRWKRATDR